MNSFLVGFLLLAASTVKAQSQCSKTDMALVGTKVKFTSVPNAIAKIPRQISGSLNITDGCDFTVSYFNIYPPCSGTYFYGVPAGQSGDDYPRVVQAAIGTFDGQTVNYAIQGVSWKDLDGLRLYCEGEKIAISEAMWVADKQQDDSNGGLRSGVKVGASVLTVVAVFAAMFL